MLCYKIHYLTMLLFHYSYSCYCLRHTAYGFSSEYTAYDTARRRLTSDYSRATGVWMNTGTSYYGNGYWWMRSPYIDNSGSARGVGSDGLIDDNRVGDPDGGVVPALKIRLS